jgi:hypothetical protein
MLNAVFWISLVVGFQGGLLSNSRLLTPFGISDLFSCFIFC